MILNEDMCNFPWSNDDTFQIFSTCHIYIPIRSLLYSLLAIGSFAMFLYGLYETKRRIRKDIPLSCTVLGLFLGLSYTISLGKNIIFADKNLGLNIIHAIARGLMHLNLNIFTFRHMEVVFNINSHIVSKHSELLTTLNQISYYMSLGYFPLELLGFILPTIISTINFTAMVASVTLIIMPVIIGLHIYFAWQLRQIIQQIEGDRNLYDPIQKQLEKLCVSALISGIIAEVLTIFWITIPAIHENLYILYSIQMMSSLMGAFSSLYNTRGEPDTNQKKIITKSRIIVIQQNVLK